MGCLEVSNRSQYVAWRSIEAQLTRSRVRRAGEVVVRTVQLAPTAMIAVLLGGFAVGCGETPPASASASSPTAPGSAPKVGGTGKKSCADYGGTGDGTFEKMCLVPKIPNEAKWTGAFEKDPFGKEVGTIEIKNGLDHELTWATISVWCYDGDTPAMFRPTPGGTSTPYQRWYVTGSGVLRDKSGKAAAPGATVSIRGPQKDSLPEKYDSCVVETTGWGYEDKGEKMYFMANRPQVSNIDKRPKAGF